MAYPFAAAPKCGELKKRLASQFNCEFLIEKDVQSESGDVLYIGFFKREHDGKFLRCAVDLQYFSDDEKIIALPVVKSICARLKIDPKHFGYTLN